MTTSLRVFIADDEPLARQMLEQALAGLQGVELVGSAQDGQAAAEALQHTAADLLLLDIEMPNLNGVELAAALRKGAGPDIVFVTAFDDRALEAFEVEALDYVVKPFTTDRLHAAIERAKRRRNPSPPPEPAGPPPPSQSPFDSDIWVPGRQAAVRVPVAGIEWIEAAGDYVLLHTSTRSHMLRATVGSLAERLDPAVILRTHRSSMVRIDRVRGIQRTAGRRLLLVLESGVSVAVGDRYRDAVQAALGIT